MQGEAHTQKMAQKSVLILLKQWDSGLDEKELKAGNPHAFVLVNLKHLSEFLCPPVCPLCFQLLRGYLVQTQWKMNQMMPLSYVGTSKGCRRVALGIPCFLVTCG